MRFLRAADEPDNAAGLSSSLIATSPIPTPPRAS